MPEKIVSIEIKTSDKSLISDLKDVNIPDLKIAQRLSFCDSAEWIPPAEKLIAVIIDSSSAIALSLLSSWLYDRFIKKKPNETTINNTNIVNNPENITIVINNSIQIIKDNENNQK